MLAWTSTTHALGFEAMGSHSGPYQAGRSLSSKTDTEASEVETPKPTAADWHISETSSRGALQEKKDSGCSPAQILADR